MFRRWTLVSGLILLGISAGHISLRRGNAAEEPQPGAVRVFDFEAGVNDWVSLDPEAKVESVTGEGKAKVGNGALAFRYTPRKGVFSLLACQKLSIAGARSATFYVKTEQSTVLLFSLREKNDARYQTMLYNPAGDWVCHTVDFSELSLADDAKDDNNQLDIDQVDTVILADMAIAAAQASDKPGDPRVLYLDDLRFKSTPVVAGEQGQRTIDDFDNGVGGWMPMRMEKDKGIGVDPDAHVSTTDTPENVKSGKKALEYHYKVGSGVFSVLSRRLPGSALAKAAGLRLWAKTSNPTVLVIALSERGGARYNAPFYCPKDVYQHVTLTPADFQLDDHSKDPGRPIDLSQVVSFDVADAAGFLAMMTKQTLSGERTIYLDGIEAVPPGEEGKKTDAAAAWSDDFQDGLIQWIPVRVMFDPLSFNLLGDSAIQVVQPKDRPAGTKVLEFPYFVAAKTVAGLMRPMPRLKAGSANSLKLILRSGSNTTIIVNLKEREEAEYQYKVALQQTDGWKVIEVPLMEFKLGEGKTDKDGQLDVDQLKEVSIIDVSMGEGNTGQNTLWIESISLVAK